MEHDWWKAVAGGIAFTAIALAALANSCAGAQEPGVPFESLCADEHLRKAEEEHRVADEHFTRIRPERVEPAGWGEAPLLWGPYYGETYELGDPEQYTFDPRVRDPNERDVDEARRHRALAERHEAAAAELRGGCPRSRGES